MERLMALDEWTMEVLLWAGTLNMDNPGTDEDVSRAIHEALDMAAFEEVGNIIRRPSVQHTAHEEVLAPAPDTSRDNTSAPACHDTWVPANVRATIMATLDAEAAQDDGDGYSMGVNIDTEKACLICLSVKDSMLELACGHQWCKTCLCRSVANGMRTGANWPPRCCAPLTEETIVWLQIPGVVRMWRQMRSEMETPGGQRVYCARRTCAEFIPARNGEGSDVLCLACGERTCRLCAGHSHPGRPCTIEEEDQMLMNWMDNNEAGFCPECYRITLLGEGCNHIHCVCGFNWCFICGEAYHVGHRCPQYGGHQLRRPARERRIRFRQGRGEQDHRPLAPEMRQPNFPAEDNFFNELDPFQEPDFPLAPFPPLLDHDDLAQEMHEFAMIAEEHMRTMEALERLVHPPNGVVTHYPLPSLVRLLVHRELPPQVQLLVRRGPPPLARRELSPLVRRGLPLLVRRGLPLLVRRGLPLLVQSEVLPLLRREPSPLVRRELLRTLPLTLRCELSPLLQREVPPLLRRRVVIFALLALLLVRQRVARPPSPPAPPIDLRGTRQMHTRAAEAQHRSHQHPPAFAAITDAYGNRWAPPRDQPRGGNTFRPHDPNFRRPRYPDMRIPEPLPVRGTHRALLVQRGMRGYDQDEEAES
ncbi:hypothetical protein ACHAQA_000366 [Verticillium albo-atrum]